jgi:hypothetical protein
VDGTRTRDAREAIGEGKQGGASTSTPDVAIQTARSSPGFAGASADLVVPNAEPSDADLEAAIVRAMLDGRGEVADLLARQLRAKQAARAGNVVDLETARAWGR